MNYKSGFPSTKPYDLVKKLDKTKEARQGDPVIKRRNGRHNNRSIIMHLGTYLSLKNDNG